MQSGLLVIDLMSQNHPVNVVLGFARGQRTPMRDGDILDPAQINRVVDVILPVDVIRPDGNDKFESRRNGRHVEERSENELAFFHGGKSNGRDTEKAIENNE